MKVRHIHCKPWTRKGPEHRAWKRWSRSQRRQAAHRWEQMAEACRTYMLPVL